MVGMSFDIVVATDRDWGIGKLAGMPWPRLRGDLQHFKRVTSTTTPGMRNAIVMGRRTWESVEVARKPLPSRLNIVVSRGTLSVPDGVIVAPSLDAALAVPLDVGGIEGAFVIGGGVLYADALVHPALRYVYLTRIDDRFACDTRIPDLDALGFSPVAWDGAQTAEDNGVRYSIHRLRAGEKSLAP